MLKNMKQQIRNDLKEAMKAKDKLRTNTIRMLLAAILKEETEGTKHEATDEDILKLIAREIKKRKESAEIYATNGRQDLADNELAEAEVLADYQPKQLTDAELADLVQEVISQFDAPQMGPVMQAATKAAAGRVDGKRLSTAVRAALNS